MATWLGVDVGGARKQFDAALIDERSLLWRGARLSQQEVLAVAFEHRVNVVAVDAPCACAAPGERSRRAERELAAAVCHIRYTPDEREVRANEFHDWVVRGLALHRALEAAGLRAVEVFPTASFTRWVGPRAGERRSAWSARALATLGLEGTTGRMSQDARDAIAAAATARQLDRGECELFGGELAVPRQRR
jgi:predicted nuclease with RNAse H fold